ncbi:imidazole glycerol phosphate synthase subunit HisF [Peptostreptococcus faecalis]|uniref:imidazole glycerol phosphate synthase subunit HisF n=1 Tax=Peptostreptococcus faecalis TaxID=2045015 RepID=UPI000C797B96|nr:imidazole glycerol phosphate synthase subunit HisF [Peptostreptococcus faecalis]
MEYKKIIPCMDVRDGKVVKGTNFKNIREIADPIEMSKFYDKSGADELVFYDIGASMEGRTVFIDMLKDIAFNVSIPLVVGGGISSMEDVDRVMSSGADKVSINSGAIKNPQLIKDASEKYGKECVILSVDVSKVDGKYHVFTKGGSEDTGMDAIEWVKKLEKLGAGELVLNSIDTDGVRNGFDLDMLRDFASEIKIPIIASGGAGKKEDFSELFKIDGISTGLAAGIFHEKVVDIADLKDYLIENGVNVKRNVI